MKVKINRELYWIEKFLFRIGVIKIKYMFKEIRFVCWRDICSIIFVEVLFIIVKVLY